MNHKNPNSDCTKEKVSCPWVFPAYGNQHILRKWPFSSPEPTILINLIFATPQIKMKTIQEKIERMDLTMARRPKGNYEAYIN